MLYLNGEPLLTKALAERRTLMHQQFHEVDGKFRFAREKTISLTANGDNADAAVDVDVEGEVGVSEEAGAEVEATVEKWLHESLREGCEGLMCKALDGRLATYEPTKRSEGWAKIKKDYIEGVADSLDLVSRRGGQTSQPT